MGEPACERGNRAKSSCGSVGLEHRDCVVVNALDTQMQPLLSQFPFDAVTLLTSYICGGPRESASSTALRRRASRVAP